MGLCCFFYEHPRRYTGTHLSAVIRKQSPPFSLCTIPLFLSCSSVYCDFFCCLSTSLKYLGFLCAQKLLLTCRVSDISHFAYFAKYGKYTK